MPDHPTEVHFEVGRAELEALSEEGLTGIPAKAFYVCRYDMTDDRVYHLSWGTFPAERSQEPEQRAPLKGTHRLSVWQPDVSLITFFLGASDKVTRDYLGMEFTDWAPGWCFLRLGVRRSQ